VPAMSNVTEVAACRTKIASDVLWTDDGLDESRGPIAFIGLVLALITFISFSYQHRAHMKEATKEFKNSGYNPNPVLPVKTQLVLSILRLGRIMVISAVMRMCLPELGPICNLIEWLYRAYAYSMLYELILLQFGGQYNATRADGSGTLQQHEPSSIWANIPCCCIWGPFYLAGCMPKRKFTREDLTGFPFSAQFCMLQFCIVGPLSQILVVMISYGIVNQDRIANVALAAQVLSVASLMTCIYGMTTLLAVCGASEYIVDQALKHKKDLVVSHELLAGHPKGALEGEEHPAHGVLKAKSSFMSLSAATPALAGLVISFIITKSDDIHFSDGTCLTFRSQQAFYLGFVTIILQLLSSIFSWLKIGPQEDHDIVMEFAATRELESQVLPGFIMEPLSETYSAELKRRVAAGIDVNMGMSSDKMASFFDKHHLGKLHDGTGETVEAEMVSGAPGLAGQLAGAEAL